MRLPSGWDAGSSFASLSLYRHGAGPGHRGTGRFGQGQRDMGNGTLRGALDGVGGALRFVPPAHGRRDRGRERGCHVWGEAAPAPRSMDISARQVAIHHADVVNVYTTGLEPLRVTSGPLKVGAACCLPGCPCDPREGAAQRHAITMPAVRGCPPLTKPAGVTSSPEKAVKKRQPPNGRSNVALSTPSRRRPGPEASVARASRIAAPTPADGQGNQWPRIRQFATTPVTGCPRSSGP